VSLDPRGRLRCNPTSLSDSAVVTVGVINETFRVQVFGERQINAARAAQAGGEVATELCDGRPSDVERQGAQSGGGRFCPWTARVLDISRK
jgi:hypothetical protein